MPVFEYAPAPESRAVVDIAPSYGLFIDGEFGEAGDGKVFKTLSPSSEEVLSEVAQAGAEDVDRAVKAARKAFTSWSALPGSERAKYLFRIARIIQERSRELAVLESLDNGKPIRESRDSDLPLVAAHFFYYAGWADKLAYAGYGREPKPLGVAGQIIPWNFPLLMLAWKIAPALATGNTVVLKPAETTPLSALFSADICAGGRAHPAGRGLTVTAGDGSRAELRVRDDEVRQHRGEPAPAGGRYEESTVFSLRASFMAHHIGDLHTSAAWAALCDEVCFPRRAQRVPGAHLGRAVRDAGVAVIYVNEMYPAPGLGHLSNAAGPLIIAALYHRTGYQSVFCFIVGTWLLGALILAVFGPRTRTARTAAAERPRAVVRRRGDTGGAVTGRRDDRATR
ncbi:NAD/NADP-dependent betaine aldehyde dehydrogenase [Streptomyces antimycoticus]